MANYKKHLSFGVSIGFVATAIYNLHDQKIRKEANPHYKFNAGELLLKSIGGAVICGGFAVMPDLLEPATHPHHRKFFHSITAAGLVGAAMYKSNQNQNIPDVPKGIIIIAGLGYLSHLALDGETTLGLPLVA